MSRSLIHHVVLLWCFTLAAVADVEKPNTILNSLDDFVNNNSHFHDIPENNLNSYLFDEDDLYKKGNRMTNPNDRLDVVNDDNLVDNEALGNELLTLTQVDDNDLPTDVRDSFVDSVQGEDCATVIVDRHIADNNNNVGSKMKASANATKIIHSQQETHHTQDTEARLMMKGKSHSHDNQAYHHDAIREGSSNQRQRELGGCVSSASDILKAVKKASTSDSYSTKITVCTQRIKLGSLNRRRSRRRLQSSIFNGTNVTLTGVAGGIDLSNRSITFICLLKQRCILDGEGISRIFYGTNASISIDGFQFLNASSLVGDVLGSGSALTLIGSSRVIIRDSSFVYNTAPNVGGAIMINNSTLTLKNSRRKTQFLNNEATYGGAIFGLHATVQTNVTASSMITFEDNYANHDGGAVYVMNSTVVCNQINLEKNDAANGGAAMFIDTNVTMTNLHVSRNEANRTGGAFVFLRANVVIKNSTFESNNRNGTVEAINFESSAVQVTDSTFHRSRWYVDSSTLNLTNACLPRCSNCVIGASCNDCCKPYLSCSTTAGYFCGPCATQPCGD